jgi:hydroxymethylpyrimidine pyrophosphatase-like HAD family hydrolase
MKKRASVVWNSDLKLAISDVDETIADVYTAAEPEMITEISAFLQEGGKLFMVTGGSLRRVTEGITNSIEPSLRMSILISHCSGAEVWGFLGTGKLRDAPFYSTYDELFTESLKAQWREVVTQLMEEFGLRPHFTQSKAEFLKRVGYDPRDIIYDDRGPQITLELINAYDLTDEQLNLFDQQVLPTKDKRRDLRLPLMERAKRLLNVKNIPITPRLGGVFALDFALEGVSKTTSVRYVLENPEVLATIGLDSSDLCSPSCFEVWGDKYSILHGGTDRHMSEALEATVRSIDFRREDPQEFPQGYNIVLWDGKRQLHHGLLEYLQSRKATR